MLTFVARTSVVITKSAKKRQQAPIIKYEWVAYSRTGLSHDSVLDWFKFLGFEGVQK
jgi:hypothetical protein